MAPLPSAFDSGIHHDVYPGDKVTCKCGRLYSFSSFSSHISYCEKWKRALLRHKSRINKEMDRIEKKREEAQMARKAENKRKAEQTKKRKQQARGKTGEFV
jgi:hypothetical protein